MSLEDYAYVSQGMVAWANVSKDTAAWNLARDIAITGLDYFHNENGWQLSASLAIPYNARELVLADQTMPSPSATLLQTLNTIATHRQETRQAEAVLRYADIDLPDVVNAPLWYGTHINLIQQLLE